MEWVLNSIVYLWKQNKNNTMEEGMTKENNIEQKFIDKLIEQKYTYRPNIRTRDALNQKSRNTKRE